MYGFCVTFGVASAGRVQGLAENSIDPLVTKKSSSLFGIDEFDMPSV